MSFNEKLSYTEHVVTTPATDFSIGFKDYGADSDTIKVTVDDVLATEAGYTVFRKNAMTIALEPAVTSGVVRLQRETNIDSSFYRFTAGAKFVAANMDANFEQILHSQQETRDGFTKLAADVYPLVNGLEEALEKADSASQAAQEAAEAAEDAAQVTRGASQVIDASGLSQQQLNDGLESIAEMLAIANPKTGNSVTTKSYIAGLNKGGAKYTYDATRAAENNGVTCINGWVKNNTSRLLASQAGCREGNFENTDLLNNLMLVASNEGIKEVILDGFYKIGKLEKGITTTPFGAENAWWLLKARSNVTVKGRSWSDGLLIAGGLVASNASEPNTKGYMVFGDYNQSNVENFKIKNFTIDNNGQENLLPAVVGFGSQALCPNVWFQRGKNIGVFDIHFKDNAGHQTVVLDSGVKGAKVIGNTFTDNGKGLPNNVNIVDHSTVYIRATDFWVTNNTFTFETLKPDISTALEIHGVNGHVSGNTTNGYPFPLIRASFFGQVSKNVLVYDNIFNGCNYGVNLDGGANSPLYVDVYNNKFNFRAEKPADGRPQVAVGHTQVGGFVAVTPTSTHDIIINIRGNEFIQPPPTGNWTIYNEFDNCLWDGGKCTEVNFKNNTFKGFKGGYRINYLNGLAKYSFDDTLTNCGSQSTPIKSLIVYQNVDSAWTVPVTSINANSKLIYCLYDYQINFVSAVTPVVGVVQGSSTNWIMPYEGYNPDSSNFFRFEYSVDVVDPNKILYAQGTKVLGKISLPNDQYFYKQNGYVGRWNMHRTLSVSPTSPRFFGDIKGDRVDILAPSAGGYASYVCTMSGADVNTVGTWKGYGMIQA